MDIGPRTHIDAGELDKRLEILKLPEVPTRDEFGQETSQPQVVATRWAAVTPISDVKFYFAEQPTAEITHAIVMRFEKNLKITAKNVLRLKGTTRLFNVESPRNIREYGEMLVILAKEQN